MTKEEILKKLDDILVYNEVLQFDISSMEAIIPDSPIPKYARKDMLRQKDLIEKVIKAIKEN